MTEKLQCPQCGQTMAEGTRFCPHDGAPLAETATRAEHTPTPRPMVPAAPPRTLPLLVGGRYRLLEERGGGGMARVYRGIDQTLEREVAVKLINPELRNEAEFDARFQREARIASQLHDPHIVVVHDFGIDGEHGPYLVMEFLQGQSLRERLSGGPLPLKAGLQLGAQLILALLHAHDKGIIHRDIKPDNIFLLNVSGVRLHVRVLDFGIARIYRGDDPAHHAMLTQPGAVLGTPRYMSPEQLAGQTLDARSDLYSAAMVIHEALTGQLPYLSGRRLTEMCPDATEALEQLLGQCLKPNPAERPPSALEVYLRLQELGKASGILLLPPGAMDKLVASRASQAPTVAYVPKADSLPWWKSTWNQVAEKSRYAFRWLGGGFAKKRGERGLAGIEIGDSRDAVVIKMGKTPREAVGDPLSIQTTPAVAHTLKSNDVPGNPSNLRTLVWEDEAIAVVLQDSTVCAVVVRTPGDATCPRGIRIGESVARVLSTYKEAPEVSTVTLTTPMGEHNHVQVYRYPTLGIGFDVLGGEVNAITLFPTPRATRV